MESWSRRMRKDERKLQFKYERDARQSRRLLPQANIKCEKTFNIVEKTRSWASVARRLRLPCASLIEFSHSQTSSQFSMPWPCEVFPFKLQSEVRILSHQQPRLWLIRNPKCLFDSHKSIHFMRSENKVCAVLEPKYYWHT